MNHSSSPNYPHAEADDLATKVADNAALLGKWGLFMDGRSDSNPIAMLEEDRQDLEALTGSPKTYEDVIAEYNKPAKSA